MDTISPITRDKVFFDLLRSRIELTEILAAYKYPLETTGYLKVQPSGISHYFVLYQGCLCKYANETSRMKKSTPMEQIHLNHMSEVIQHDVNKISIANCGIKANFSGQSINYQSKMLSSKSSVSSMRSYSTTSSSSNRFRGWKQYNDNEIPVDISLEAFDEDDRRHWIDALNMHIAIMSLRYRLNISDENMDHYVHLAEKLVTLYVVAYDIHSKMNKQHHHST